MIIFDNRPDLTHIRGREGIGPGCGPEMGRAGTEPPVRLASACVKPGLPG